MDYTAVQYQRVLLKISGEALKGRQGYGFDPDEIDRVASEVKAVTDLGTEVCLVVGGGNIFRGLKGAGTGMERATADYIGMLATVMNGLALQAAFERLGVHSRVQSALPIAAVCEPYIRRRAIRHMEKKRVVIFSAGTGNPYFTTDTAATLRASEMGCDAFFKATMVDGVYTADPKIDGKARRFERLSYRQVLSQELKVMDATAISLARENKIPILVFSIHENGAFANVIQGRGRFTLISDDVTEGA